MSDQKRARVEHKFAAAFASLKQHGYAVIEGVVSAEQCAETAVQLKDFLRAAGVAVDDPKLRMSSYPNSHGIVQHLEAGQQQAIWDIRTNDAVVSVFEEMWGDNDLLSSTDGFCWMPAHYAGVDRSWLHTDQSFKKIGLNCVQGYVNVLTSHDAASGSLYVLPGSHLLHDEFAAAHPDAAASGKDWHKYTPEQLAFFGTEPVRVHGGVGSLVLWDSRTVHSAIPPQRGVESPRERCVVYVCYQPRALCSKKNLEKKRDIYENYRMTTHYPAQKVEMFPIKWRTYGAEDTGVRTPPRNRVASQRMLELAGCVPMTSRVRRIARPALDFNFLKNRFFGSTMSKSDKIFKFLRLPHNAVRATHWLRVNDKIVVYNDATKALAAADSRTVDGEFDKKVYTLSTDGVCKNSLVVRRDGDVFHLSGDTVVCRVQADFSCSVRADCTLVSGTMYSFAFGDMRMAQYDIDKVLAEWYKQNHGWDFVEQDETLPLPPAKRVTRSAAAAAEADTKAKK